MDNDIPEVCKEITTDIIKQVIRPYSDFVDKFESQEGKILLHNKAMFQAYRILSKYMGESDLHKRCSICIKYMYPEHVEDLLQALKDAGHNARVERSFLCVGGKSKS